MEQEIVNLYEQVQETPPLMFELSLQLEETQRDLAAECNERTAAMENLSKKLDLVRGGMQLALESDDVSRGLPDKKSALVRAEKFLEKVEKVDDVALCSRMQKLRSRLHKLTGEGTPELGSQRQQML